MPLAFPLKKPDLVGLTASVVVSFATIISTPAMSWAMHWQVIVVVVPLILNLWFWRKKSIPAMSSGKAVGQLILGLVVIAGIAVFDTALGFAFGAHSALEAFLNSGPAGGPLDIFLATMYLFVGLPTVARSVFSFYMTDRDAVD